MNETSSLPLYPSLSLAHWHSRLLSRSLARLLACLLAYLLAYQASNPLESGPPNQVDFRRCAGGNFVTAGASSSLCALCLAQLVQPFCWPAAATAPRRASGWLAGWYFLASGAQQHTQLEHYQRAPLAARRGHSGTHTRPRSHACTRPKGGGKAPAEAPHTCANSRPPLSRVRPGSPAAVLACTLGALWKSGRRRNEWGDLSRREDCLRKRLSSG